MEKIAVITVGARLIGAATSKLFAENGAHIFIADIVNQLRAALAAGISGSGRCIKSPKNGGIYL